MAVQACVEPERRLSWPVLLLTVAAVTSSSLSALSLYQLVVLHAEVEELKSEVCRRRQDGQEGQQRAQMDNAYTRKSSQDTLRRSESGLLARRRRMTSSPETTGSPETTVSQSCLQFIANANRNTSNKESELGLNTAIPWQTGLRRGSALKKDNDRILIQQEGYYYVYSQVYYKDTRIVMGHWVIRWKASVVGNEAPYVILFSCIKNMREKYSFNTCYTGGIVKLEVGDHLELLIPNNDARVSLDGDSTFMGVFKLV